MRSQRLVNRRLIRSIIKRGHPWGQFEQSRTAAAEQADLGLGFVYYALARILKPEHVVVVGSYRGFSVICTALGLTDNGKGRLDFIDAALVDDFWTKPARVRRHFQLFGVDSRVTLHRMTTREWLEKNRRAHRRRPFVDLLLLDGDHTVRGVEYDYRALGPLVKEGGYICLHDSFAGGFGQTEWEVADFLSTLEVDLFEALTLEIAKGLTIIKKLPREFLPSSRLSARQKLRADLDRLRHARNGVGRADIPTLQRRLRRTLVESVHIDRSLEMRHRFLAKSNRDLRKLNRAMRLQLKELRAQVERQGRARR